MHKIKQLYIHLNKGAFLMTRITKCSFLKRTFQFPKINFAH